MRGGDVGGDVEGAGVVDDDLDDDGLAAIEAPPDRAADCPTLDWGEDDDDDLDDDGLAAIEASRDRAADRQTLDWGEDDDDDDDEVDWEALDAIEAKYRQGQMSGVAIDVDGREGTLHD